MTDMRYASKFIILLFFVNAFNGRSHNKYLQIYQPIVCVCLKCSFSRSRKNLSETNWSDDEVVIYSNDRKLYMICSQTTMTDYIFYLWWSTRVRVSEVNVILQ